ncbi:hypothetical protein SNE40_000868 [Patella caerulea]|uniref:Uncharacterized protein n=1 Tax=Patella caerulea TaxID=87958 RepID=A0AAN8KKZ6_PATCE
MDTKHPTQSHADETKDFQEVNLSDKSDGSATILTSMTFTTHRKYDKRKICLGIFLAVLLGVGITIGLAFYFKHKENRPISKEAKPLSSPPYNKVLVDCYPERHNGTQNECIVRGCLWITQTAKGEPRCIYPEGHGYRLKGGINKTAAGFIQHLQKIQSTNIYGGRMYDELTVHVEYQTKHRLRIKIYPGGAGRYEIPIEALDIESSSSPTSSDEQLYDVNVVEYGPQFGVVVRRKSTNTTVFSTDIPGMTFSDQFLQITTRLPSDNLYGFGEHNHRQFKHDMNWRTWSIFTRDSAPVGPENLYGAHPVYLNLEDDGNASMVLLKNSNGMDITLQPNPNPAVTYRVIGGILDFYIFMGPSPEQAVQQYIQAIGLPIMPPYWSLGFHLSRWGYKDLEDMQMVINRTRDAGIPYDVQWADIDYMYHFMDFTYDKSNWSGLPDLVENLHRNNQKFVVILDSGIASNTTLIHGAEQNSPGFNIYQDGIDKQMYVKDASGNALIGEVWPGQTAYPDFTRPNTMNWWLKWMRYLRKNESIEFDALWIDMNEPSSFVDGSIQGCNSSSKLNYPPYGAHILGTEIDGRLFGKTLCMDSQQHWGRHYDVHNLYAHSQAIRIHDGLSNMSPLKRPWAMTRSSFVGTGKYATKWMGDNQSKWPQLHWSIVSIMEFSMFGFAMNGADMCGFWYEADYEMCLRWHQLGAFYPFSRNHNAKGDYPVIFKHQDPAGWDEHFIDIVKPVLLTRYRLLPYLYTLMYKAHEEGYMVMKALLFEFPEDRNTWSIDRQFLLGPALLISPALEQNQTVVDAYFPKGRWYEYHTGEEITNTGVVHQLYTPLDKFNLHLRGGYVIPWQEPSTTTYQSRTNFMGIIIALDENQLANGELFWDDGESLETYKNNQSSVLKFTMVKAGELTFDFQTNNYRAAELRKIQVIEIYGLDRIPDKVFVDDTRVDDYKIRQSGKVGYDLELV